MSDPNATHDDAIHDDDAHIVEVYSAANEVEAGAVHAALQDAGINARLVGNFLGNATGDLPLGFRTDPKILELETDAAAARAIIDRFHDEAAARHAAEADAPEALDDDFGDGLDDGPADGGATVIM